MHPSFPARDYPTFLQVLKSNPGKFSFASSRNAAVGHMQMALYTSLSGTFMTHIPYRGTGSALNDTVTGPVPIVFDNLPSALPFIKSGQLVVSVVAAAIERTAEQPEVKKRIADTCSRKIDWVMPPGMVWRD